MRRLLFVAAALLLAAAARADLIPTRLRCEYKTDPLAIDAERPRLFWRVESPERDQRQSAYRLLAARSPEALAANRGDLWDSGKVPSDETLHLVYGGTPPRPGETVYWKVQVWDRDGKASRWSPVARWSRGIGASDWKARWIALPPGNDGPAAETLEGAQWIWFAADPAPPGAVTRWFRLRFDLPAGVRSARLLATADDQYVATLNGRDVARGGAWNVYQSVDAAPALRPGANTLLLQASNSGPNPAGVLARLIVRTDAGERSFGTDSAWEAAAAVNGPWTPAKGIGAFGSAPWGRPQPDSAGQMPPATHFRKPFTLAAPVRRARIYATALGIYALALNGQPVRDEVLSPGWSDYRKRVYYCAYDVTKQLRAGENVLGATLGDGWYCGYLGFTGRRRNYGDFPRLLAQLVIEYADGRSETIGTDASWQATDGAIRHGDLLMGSAIDYRKALPGWDAPGYAGPAGRWQAAQEQPAPAIALEAHPGNPVRPQETLRARRRTVPKPGVFVYDLGQNFTGWVRVKVQGKPGQTITLRHVERLNPDGTAYTANLRAARATDTFTLAKSGTTVCEPAFTFHGFQYVEITGCDRAPALREVEGIVIHSDLPRAGRFSSDNPLLDRLALNTDWGQRGNYVDVPTDCPQRDERLGWTGDAQVFAKAAAFNRDIAAFFTKWLVDLIEDGQFPDGRLPDVAPSIGGGGNAAWEDAGVLCTYRLYEMYGDTAAIRRHWERLNRYMEHLAQVSPGLLRPAGAYGDWLLLDGPQHSAIHGTAYYFECARRMATMAAAIGKTDEAARYAARAQSIREAFQKAFVTEDGRVEDNGRTSQTFYALALAWNLVPDDRRALAARHLARLIQARGDHLATGFIGTPVLLPALTSAGRADVAYRLLLSETYPSWLYQVKLGATTMWERWDGWTPEKGFQDPGMNSFNHYWLGCVTEWLQTGVGGIDTDGPGWKRVIVFPQTVGALKRARAEYDSIRGKIVSAWEKRDDGALALEVTIPANVQATVLLPARPGATITESGRPVTPRRGGSNSAGETRAEFEIGSGTYRFVVSP